MHNWMPHITVIESVTNFQQEKLFQRVKAKAFGDLEVLKFHGTSNEGVQGIIKEG